MIVSWIIYFAVLVATGAFFILYKDVLALILFLTVIFVPIFLLTILLISFFFIKIDVDIDKNMLNYSDPVKVIIRIKNRSPFAVSNIKLHSICRNIFLKTEHYCKFVINAAPFTTKQFVYEIVSKNVGNIEVLLKKAVFYDFFSMFAFTKKINESKIIPVYPKLVSVTSNMRSNDLFKGDSDIYSKSSMGDDPTEIFDVREFRDGDKLNKIHWKLTSKTDKYMVKDYSLSVSDNVFIYIDLKIDQNKDDYFSYINSLEKVFASISCGFADDGIFHNVGWYDCNRNAFISSKVNSKQDVYSTINKQFSASVFNENPIMEKCEYFNNTKYSHIVFITANSVKEVESQFSVFDTSSALLSIVSIGNQNNEFPSDDRINLISVSVKSEEQCLQDIEF